MPTALYFHQLHKLPGLGTRIAMNLNQRPPPEPEREKMIATLETLVMDVIAENPTGITHAQLVTALRKHGCEYDSNLSEDTFRVVRRLIRDGVLQKNPETRQITAH
jgi:hypothetical protein